MGSYHLELNPDAKKLCTIVLPWGKYEYQQPPRWGFAIVQISSRKRWEA